MGRASPPVRRSLFGLVSPPCVVFWISGKLVVALFYCVVKLEPIRPTLFDQTSISYVVFVSLLPTIVECGLSGCTTCSEWECGFGEAPDASEADSICLLSGSDYTDDVRYCGFTCCNSKRAWSGGVWLTSFVLFPRSAGTDWHCRARSRPRHKSLLKGGERRLSAMSVMFSSWW